MRILLPVRLTAFALALWLAGAAAGAAAQAAQSTYHILIPPVVDPEHRFSVVVILHDAGGSGGAIATDPRVIAGFVDKGYAVLAPDALVRQNRRFLARGGKAGPLESSGGQARGQYSTRRYVMQDADGDVRALRWGADTGWYFPDVDVIDYGDPAAANKPLGRDEIGFLRQALEDAAKTYPIDPHPALILGLGHGGALVWEIACRAPDLARLLAPVDGAFWNEVPGNCRPGADLIHTHYRDSGFWPPEGTAGSDTRYARTPVEAAVNMLVTRDGCSAEGNEIRDDEAGTSLTRWDDCQTGGPVELMLLDQPFAFQQGWLKHIYARLDAFHLPQPFDTPDVPIDDTPAFSQPGAGTPRLGTRDAGQDAGQGSRFKSSGSASASQFKLPRANAPSPFKAPGADAGSRFLKPGDGTASPFKRPGETQELKPAGG